jgi:general secretion pathway protein F
VPQYLTRVLRQGAVSTERIRRRPRSVAAALGVRPSMCCPCRIWPTRRRRSAAPRWALPLQLFSQELAVLLDAGIALLEALNTLREKEGQPACARRWMRHRQIEQGQPLSGALRQQPQAFDELICAIVAANERPASSVALAQHARYLAWVDALRSRLVAALVYPLMLLGVGSAVILFLLLYVLPRFAGILEQTSADLPWASRVLIEFGQTAGAHPARCSPAWRPRLRPSRCCCARGAPAPAGRAVDAAGLGPRLRVLALARLYRSLAMLLASGVPALAALRSWSMWWPRPGARRCRRRPADRARRAPVHRLRHARPGHAGAPHAARGRAQRRGRPCSNARPPFMTKKPRG